MSYLDKLCRSYKVDINEYVEKYVLFVWKKCSVQESWDREEDQNKEWRKNAYTEYNTKNSPSPPKKSQN